MAVQPAAVFDLLGFGVGDAQGSAGKESLGEATAPVDVALLRAAARRGKLRVPAFQTWAASVSDESVKSERSAYRV